MGQFLEGAPSGLSGNRVRGVALAAVATPQLAQPQIRRFVLHGVEVVITATNDVLDAAVSDLLCAFAASDGPAGEQAVGVELIAVPDRARVPLPAPPARFPRRPGGGWPHGVWRDGERLMIDFDERGTVAIRAGRATVYVVDPVALAPEARVGLLYVALCELLAARGRFMMHAAAVCRQGRGVLIAGRSGSGKTTAALALVRHGWALLADDHPLIREERDELQLLPFPGPVDVGERTVGLFDELAAAPLREGTFKHRFDPGNVYSAGTGEACRPALLLFPKVVDAAESVLEPLPPVRALEELVREGLAAERRWAREHLRILTRLVGEVPAFRLWSGQDIASMPDLLAGVSL